ncbi:diacylglycerol kinase family lipid kinase [Erysipelotrichaceae bacterium OH741_COT-311]|nr:diacylglycerol kinase family lipid kinase [Erysipelotrichaceae bacterium OH741_COT-311]
MKHIFIINPESGQGEALANKDLIESVALRYNIPYQILLTQYKGHATTLASNINPKENITVYSVGGDGTLFEIVQGLDPSIPLGIIPCGSGNDFFRSLDIQYNNLEDLLIKLITGETMPIDIGTCLHHRFINCTSCGLDAEINDAATKLIRKKIVPKKIAYMAATLKAIIRPTYYPLTITIDNLELQKECLLISIMNGKYYGGGFTPAPDAKLNDGLLDICIVEKMPYLKILKLLPKYLKGKHQGTPGILNYQGKKITITSDKKIMFESDGECYLASKEEITLHPLQSNIKILK